MNVTLKHIVPTSFRRPRFVKSSKSRLLDEASPLTDKEIEALLCAAINPREGAVAVAVSGGSHSLAAAWLTQIWCRSRGIVCFAIGIDHGLRPESKDELRQAASTLLAWGMPMAILTWHKPSSLTGNLQAKAREARYNLLSQWCLQQDITCLITGHHYNDQLETILMRQHHASHTYGCAGMSQRFQRNGCLILRPFLRFPGSRLQATLQANMITWCEDPSNENLEFERVRWRRITETLNVHQRQTLHTSLVTWGQQRRYVDSLLDNFLRHHVTYLASGAAHFKTQALEQIPSEHHHRILHAVIVHVRGGRYLPIKSPSYKKFCTLKGTSTTLGGCLIQRSETVWQISREWTTLSFQFYPPGEFLWDERWLCRLISPAFIGPKGGHLYDPQASSPCAFPQVCKPKEGCVFYNLDLSEAARSFKFPKPYPLLYAELQSTPLWAPFY